MLLALTTLVGALVLLTLLSGSLVMAQQDTSEDLPQESDPVSTFPVDTDTISGDTSLIEYDNAPSTRGNAGDGQAVPVCPGPAAPGTVRCHSLVVTTP
jgi:hypothetical protein